MILDGCAFETERLDVADWRVSAADHLPARVAAILTEATTRFLPSHWQGDYSKARARQWIGERDAESPTLLVTERSTGTAVGLVILFEEPTPADPGLIDLRLGYVLAEAQWGRGLASELVVGLVAWCRDQPAIASISGGVESGNVASARVLVKSGFELVDRAEADGAGEDLYRLELV